MLGSIPLAPPTIMYKPIKDAAVDRFVLQGRERLNASLVPTDASGVKAILKHSKQVDLVSYCPTMYLIHQVVRLLLFFGIKTLTSTLASKLAAKNWLCSCWLKLYSA